MKKYFTLHLFVLLSFTGNCQTYVSGFINANTHWTVANMPYIVTGNALVSVGYTLTIDPGVLVKFNTNTALQIDGELIAIGTAANHIVFTSNQATPHAGDWGKLHISDNSIDAVFDSLGHYVSGTILKYCDVLYGGGVSFGEVHIESASPYISHCNVQYSKAAGIYCSGSTYLLDSSLVSDNTDYGLYFNDFSQFSCGLLINGDTIRNNANGGLYLGTSSATCTTEVSNNSFVLNKTHGAIYDVGTSANVTIEKNYLANDSNSQQYSGIIYFVPIVVQNIIIIQNYFSNNSTNISSSGIISFSDHGSSISINNNYFINNSCVNGYPTGIISFNSGSQFGQPSSINIDNNYFLMNSCHGGAAIIGFYNGVNVDTIKCNKFLTNQTSGSPGGVIFMSSGGGSGNSGRIISNIFDGNMNTFNNGFSIFDMQLQSGDTLEFANNTVKNNTVTSGTGCYFNAYLTTNNELLQIHHNEFSGNTAKNVIYLDGGLTNNSNYDFLYMKYNNFLDVNYNIELYNHIPYGSPNVYADSNYWGNTNTAHIDSIIYDYFDTANFSVVYYSPILIEPAYIDTTCSQGIFTTVAELKHDVTLPFPNPFSTNTQIDFNKELEDASLLVYNVFGQKVKEMKDINGSHITLNRGNLPEGIYLYEVIERERKIGNGKLIVSD